MDLGPAREERPLQVGRCRSACRAAFQQQQECPLPHFYPIHLPPPKWGNGCLPFALNPAPLTAAGSALRHRICR